MFVFLLIFFFFFKQKTAYEMRISDWSSDVCSSDLSCPSTNSRAAFSPLSSEKSPGRMPGLRSLAIFVIASTKPRWRSRASRLCLGPALWRSEEHTSELQSLMRSSYAVFCLNKKKQKENQKYIILKNTHRHIHDKH